MKKRLGLVGLLLILSLNILACQKKTEVKVQVKEYVPVNIEAVKLGKISEEKTFNGRVVPSKEIKIIPKMSGKVMSLGVNIGSEVGVGTLLFTLDSEDLQKQVNQAKKSVDLAKVQLQQASLGPNPSINTVKMQVEQAELAYQQALSSLNNAKVTSPTKGVVSQVNINQGEMASAAQPSVVILDTTQMYVEINVAENSISELSLGQEVKIDIASIGASHEGQVEIISPAPDERTQLYSVRLSIKDAPENIKSGMFVKVNLNVNSKEDVITVKSEAILEDGIKNYVYIVEENKAVRRDVEVGIESNTYTEVVSGIKVGEELLVKGQDYVEDGSRVKVIRGEE